MAHEHDMNHMFGNLYSLPGMHVEFENDGPDSDIEVIFMNDISARPPLQAMENQINSALSPDNEQNVPDDHKKLCQMRTVLTGSCLN